MKAEDEKEYQWELADIHDQIVINSGLWSTAMSMTTCSHCRPALCPQTLELPSYLDKTTNQSRLADLDLLQLHAGRWGE